MGRIKVVLHSRIKYIQNSNDHLSGLRDEEGSGEQVGRYFGEDIQ